MLYHLITEVQAREVSLGIVTSEQTGLSVQRLPDSELPGWHINTFFQSRQFIQINSDVQFFMKPLVFNQGFFRGALYSGLGLRVVSLAARSHEEKYWLRLPVGTQWQLAPMHLQVFTELAGIMGPLPQTDLFFAPVIGARVTL